MHGNVNIICCVCYSSNMNFKGLFMTQMCPWLTGAPRQTVSFLSAVSSRNVLFFLHIITTFIFDSVTECAQLTCSVGSFTA